MSGETDRVRRITLWPEEEDQVAIIWFRAIVD